MANFKIKKDLQRRIQAAGIEVPTEFFDVIEVLLLSVESGKYPANNWLEPDGKTMSHHATHMSMKRHNHASQTGVTEDADSKLHPLLHEAARCLMAYTRYKRDIVHPKDKE